MYVREYEFSKNIEQCALYEQLIKHYLHDYAAKIILNIELLSVICV